MKITYGFLIGDKLNREDIWKAYFENHETDYSIQVHSHKDNYTFNLEHIAIEQVETSWAQTVRAHFAHFNQFLRDPNNTHFVLLSESCAPLKSAQHVTKIIREVGDCFTYLSRHSHKPYKKFWNDRNTFRKTGHIRDIATAEQWFVLTRETIEVLVQHQVEIIKELKNVGADNELILTYCKRYIKDYRHKHERFWKIEWPGAGSHPEVLKNVNLQAESVYKYRLFCRKVDKTTKFENMSILKQDVINKKVAAHLHFYHPRQTQDLLIKLQKMPIEYDLYVTYSRNHPTTLKRLQQKAHYIEKVENYGFDIAPFLKLVQEGKFDDYDFVYKFHGKKNTKWRNNLVYPIVTKGNLFLQEEQTKARIAYSRKYACDLEYQNTQIINKILTEFNIERPENRKFCAGTMFIANKKYIELLKTLDIDFDNFKHEIKSDGTYSHAFERVFGYLIDPQNHFLL